jgi:hypothetical protein
MVAGFDMPLKWRMGKRRKGKRRTEWMSWKKYEMK